MAERGSVEFLRSMSEFARGELIEALDGVTEGKAWSVLPPAGDEYLHSDGSIHGITLHIAVCEVMYGSMAFRGTEIRWRDLEARVAGFEPSWTAAREYLDEAHQYWLASWAELDDGDLDREVPHFSGELRPASQIIRMMIHHDSYHAGQIAVLRYAVGQSDTPPPSVALDIRTHCASLPSW